MTFGSALGALWIFVAIALGNVGRAGQHGWSFDLTSWLLLVVLPAAIGTVMLLRRPRRGWLLALAIPSTLIGLMLSIAFDLAAADAPDAFGPGDPFVAALTWAAVTVNVLWLASMAGIVVGAIQIARSTK